MARTQVLTMGPIPAATNRLLKRWMGVVFSLACLALGPGKVPVESRFMVYDFNLGPDPVGNVDYVHSLGFGGLVTRCNFPADVVKLGNYANYVATLNGFQLLAYVNYDFNNPDSPQIWLDALPILARMDAPLWVIIKNAPAASDVQSLLLQMAQTSQTFGVQTVIYPHWDTDIENAAEAAALIAQLAHPNLSNSIHSCHEIRSGNQYSMAAVVTAHANDTQLVTIAGADDGAYFGPFPSGGQPWGDAIQPLDRSRYSLLPFLQELHDSNYDGPIILHTYGIINDPGHLQWSIRAYERYQRQIR